MGNPPAAEPAEATGTAARGSKYWKARETSVGWEYAEVLGIVACVTAVGWFVPVNYRVNGSIYLLMVLLLSLRVGRWPVLVAAVVSAVAWNFVFIPPRLSFSVLHIEDGLMLGTYFAAERLIGGLFTARIRRQESG